MTTLAVFFFVLGIVYLVVGIIQDRKLTSYIGLFFVFLWVILMSLDKSTGVIINVVY
jgi:hypothetical protein